MWVWAVCTAEFPPSVLEERILAPMSMDGPPKDIKLLWEPIYQHIPCPEHCIWDRKFIFLDPGMTFQVTKSWKVEEMEITVSWCQWVKVVVKNFTLVALKTTRRSFILSFPKLVAMSKSLDQIMLGRAWTSLLMVKKMEFHQDNFMRFPSNGEMTRNASRGDLLMLLWRPWRLKLWKRSDRNIESTGFETCEQWTTLNHPVQRAKVVTCRSSVEVKKKDNVQGQFLAISLTQSNRNFARFQTSRVYFQSFDAIAGGSSICRGEFQLPENVKLAVWNLKDAKFKSFWFLSIFLSCYITLYQIYDISCTVLRSCLQYGWNVKKIVFGFTASVQVGDTYFSGKLLARLVSALDTVFLAWKKDPNRQGQIGCNCRWARPVEWGPQRSFQSQKRIAVDELMNLMFSHTWLHIFGGALQAFFQEMLSQLADTMENWLQKGSEQTWST